MVVLQELDQQAVPNIRCVNRGSVAARFSMSSSVRRKVQFCPEQPPLIDNTTKFWNFVMEDNRVESMMVSWHWRDFSLSLTFVRDARRYNHGKASGLSRQIFFRDGKMVVGITRGGSWTVVQSDRFGSCMRWWVAASDRCSSVVKFFSDGPHRQT